MARCEKKIAKLDGPPFRQMGCHPMNFGWSKMTGRELRQSKSNPKINQWFNSHCGCKSLVGIVLFGQPGIWIICVVRQFRRAFNSSSRLKCAVLVIFCFFSAWQWTSSSINPTAMAHSTWITATVIWLSRSGSDQRANRTTFAPEWLRWGEIAINSNYGFRLNWIEFILREITPSTRPGGWFTDCLFHNKQ